VAAHYDDGLSHEKHKKTAYNGNEDEDKACEQNFIAGVVIKIFYYFSYDQIIVAVRLIVGGCTSFSCIDGMNNRVYYIACKLRRQYPEIIGEDNEEDAEKKKPAVFPEIFVECGKLGHVSAKVGVNGEC
jgi:hypothetical protein